MDYVHPLAALADPTRRAMLERLKRRPHSVSELADAAGIRQPTASEHLRVLREARLVNHRRDGTRRLYTLDPRGVEALRRYVESFWDGALAAFAKDDPTPAKKPSRRHTVRRKSVPKDGTR